MKIIPVIDIKNNIVVHAYLGNRLDYQPIDSCLYAGSDMEGIINALLDLYCFDTFYIADLNAITGQESQTQLIDQVILRFSELSFWVDQGRQSYQFYMKRPKNYLPVIGSESYKNNSISEIRLLKKKYVLSLDYSSNGVALGARDLFDTQEYWPNNIIVMTLARVGSCLGPDLKKLKEFRQLKVNKTFIAAGGVRNKDDLFLLQKIGIEIVLLATSLHTGAITSQDILEVKNTSIKLSRYL
ncbi:MAG: nickel transporter [Methylococcaceae bacterium]|nr:MAG: nickel transporter [Methylococcaceae bacterium]